MLCAFRTSIPQQRRSLSGPRFDSYPPAGLFQAFTDVFSYLPIRKLDCTECVARSLTNAHTYFTSGIYGSSSLPPRYLHHVPEAPHWGPRWSSQSDLTPMAGRPNGLNLFSLRSEDLHTAVSEEDMLPYLPQYPRTMPERHCGCTRIVPYRDSQCLHDAKPRLTRL